MTRTISLTTIFVFICCLEAVRAIFVKIRQNEQKCFIEMIRHDIVLVHYKSPDQAVLPQSTEEQERHVGLKLEVFADNGKVFDGRTDQSGRFAFTTLGQGEHRLCFRFEMNRHRST